MPSINVGAFVKALRTRALRAADPGHDSQAEIMAADSVDRYARSTGPLGGGGSTVRAFGENGSIVTAWLSPHYDDPIIVRVTAKRTTWAFADSPDEIIDPRAWMRLDDGGNNYASRRHAEAVDAILRRSFASKLNSATAKAEH